MTGRGAFPASFSARLSGSGRIVGPSALHGDERSFAGGANSTNQLSETVNATTNQLNVAGSSLAVAVAGAETVASNPTFAVSATTVTLAPGATTGTTSTITVTPAGGFTGSVAFTAALTSSPASAQYPPTLSFGSTAPVVITGDFSRHSHAHHYDDGGDQRGFVTTSQSSVRPLVHHRQYDAGISAVLWDPRTPPSLAELA